MVSSVVRGGASIQIQGSFNQVALSNKKKELVNKMRDEIRSLNRQNVWRLVQLPKHQRAISVKWTYELKLNKENKNELFKAELVGKGFMQIQGVDFDEVYSPVSKYSTFRFVLSLIVQNGRGWFLLNIKPAFLCTPLDQKCYLKLSHEFLDAGKQVHVSLLLNALYGFWQASRLWRRHFQTFLKSTGFQYTHADASFYTTTHNANITIILVYVDDLLLTGSCREFLKTTVQNIAGAYEVQIGDQNSEFLEMILEKPHRGRLILHNRPAVKNLLYHFETLNCNSAVTPLVRAVTAGLQHLLYTAGLGSLNPPENRIQNIMQYQKLDKCQMYLANSIRSDTACATSLLARFL